MSKDQLALRRNAILALVLAAGTFATIAVFDLIAHPASQGVLHTYKEYALTATILPGVAVVLWAISCLHALHGSHDGRLGRIGMRIAAAGLIGLAVDSVVTLAGGSTDTAGPLYPIGMLATLIGIVLLAIGWYHAAILPRWIGPALALGWLLGATPILGSGAAFLIMAAAFLAIALGLHHQATEHLATPVAIDSSLTA